MRQDFRNQLLRGEHDVKIERVARLFQHRELVRQDGRARKMRVAFLNPLLDHFVGALQVNDAKVQACGEDLPIRFSQGRTRQHGILLLTVQAH